MWGCTHALSPSLLCDAGADAYDTYVVACAVEGAPEPSGARSTAKVGESPLADLDTRSSTLSNSSAPSTSAARSISEPSLSHTSRFACFSGAAHEGSDIELARGTLDKDLRVTMRVRRQGSGASTLRGVLKGGGATLIQVYIESDSAISDRDIACRSCAPQGPACD